MHIWKSSSEKNRRNFFAKGVVDLWKTNVKAEVPSAARNKRSWYSYGNFVNMFSLPKPQSTSWNAHAFLARSCFVKTVFSIIFFLSCYLKPTRALRFFFFSDKETACFACFKLLCSFIAKRSPVILRHIRRNLPSLPCF